MINFWSPSPIAVPATTARQSQHSDVITSPALFSTGNRIYFFAPVRYGFYPHQWHSGGAVSVAPYRSVTGSTAPESRESDAGTAPETGECETATEALSYTQGAPAQNRILTRNQSDRVQAHSGIEPDAGITEGFDVSETAIQRRMNARVGSAYKLHKSYTKLTRSQLDSIQARLGSEPDARIAKDFGVSESSIQNRRRGLGIPAYQPHKLHISITKSQSDSIQARLGSEPDASIAADFEISETTIRRRRCAQGITAYRPRKLSKRLTQSQLDSIQARLGSETDAAIAADFGMSQTAIQHRRNTQGIAAYKPHEIYRKLTNSQLDSIQARLGSEPDASIAADFEISESTIRRHRSAQGITAYKSCKVFKKLTQSQLGCIQARLGKETDASIAADFGLSQTTIQKHRSAQGIAAYQPHRLQVKLTQRQSERIQARLGKETDANIAADFGMCVSTIQKRRSAQGIAAFNPHKQNEPSKLHKSPDILPGTDKESHNPLPRPAPQS